MNKTIAILLLICLPIVTWAQEGKYNEAFRLVEVWLEAQKDFEQLPGLSASVVEDQEILWAGAMGMANAEEALPFSQETLCSICSISKLFTSVAIMKLVDEGKLRLDDRVEDLLPTYNLKQQFEGSGPITIRSLLTHSSGLPREAAFPYWTGPDFPFPSKEEVLSGLGKQETLYPANTYFQYSNLGLTLLGEIVERVTGTSYDAYIQQHILNPLGLANTRTEMPETLYGTKLAIGYSARKRTGGREKVNFFQARGITAAAGFTSNVRDLAKFASWQFRLRDTSTVEILKPSTLKYMHQVHWTNPDWKVTWGLGFVVYKGSDGTTWVGHGGSCPGYRSALQLDLKNKRGYVVMINAGGTNPGKYIRGIRHILKKAEEMDNDDKKTSINLDDYIGYYDQQPWGSETYFGSWKGMLVSLDLPTDDPGEAMTLYKHISSDTFRRLRDDKELGETLTFERDAAGRVVRAQSHGNYIDKMLRE